MDSTSYFDRLVATAERIARHAAYPGKEQALGQCLRDLDDLADAGQITVEQREQLRAVLLGGLSHAA